MRNLLMIICVSLVTTLFSQDLETQNFNGITFYKISDQWHFLDEDSQQMIPLSKRVVSIKYNNQLTDGQIESFEEQFEIASIRKAITGWQDYYLKKKYRSF